MRDILGRKIDYLRISVTDRCNLRCRYCIDEKECSFLPESQLLSVDEIGKIAGAAGLLGVKKVRITGGEPLVRKDIVEIVRTIKSMEGIEEIAMTTNGIFLEEKLPELLEAGLTGVNISLDALDREKFSYITVNGDFDRVMRGIRKALDSELKSVKLNVVSLKDINDSEFLKLAELTKDNRIDVRYIELMPIGLGKKFDTVFSDEILKLIGSNYELMPLQNDTIGGPAKYYKISGSRGRIGFITPLSHEFCDSCNRIRVTPNGFLKLCLHWKRGIDLKQYLNDEVSVEALKIILAENILKKPDMHEMKSENENEDFESKMMNEIGG